MEKLTELEKVLIGYLKISKARAGVQATAFLLLREESQQMEMCEFLSKKRDGNGAANSGYGAENCGVNILCSLEVVGDARANYQELLPLKLITVKRNLLPGTGEILFLRVERDWRGIGAETDGASRFWETVPKAGRFFCAIVEL